MRAAADAGRDARVETASVEAVLAAFDEEAGGKPRSGYVANIQGDLAVSANKRSPHRAHVRLPRPPKAQVVALRSSPKRFVGDGFGKPCSH